MPPRPQNDARAPRSGRRAEEVIAEVDAWAGRACAGCPETLLGQEVVTGLLLGLDGAPRCASCAAGALGLEPLELLRRAAASVRRLECFRAGWARADRLLDAAGEWPAARLPRELRMDADEDELEDTGPGEDGARAAVAASYDAGDMGCGDLVLELRGELARLAPGEVLLVRATDPGAPADLPAWARLTGHALVRREHALYWFRRRD